MLVGIEAIEEGEVGGDTGEATTMKAIPAMEDITQLKEQPNIEVAVKIVAVDSEEDLSHEEGVEGVEDNEVGAAVAHEKTPSGAFSFDTPSL